MRYILIIILICSGTDLIAQKIIVDNSDFFYQIAPIFDFKESIVSLTFDDGSLNQFKIALPLMKERKIPATFYVITNLVDSLIKRIILDNLSKDYEIGSHTVSHPDLFKIGSEEVLKEFLNSRLFLQRNFGINSGLTMSYPWGMYNKSIKQIAKNNYLAARSTDLGYNSFYKLDRYAIKTQYFDKNTIGGAFIANTWVDYAIRNHLWLVEMIHGINNESYAPINSGVLIEHLDFINKNENNIWCSTISNVIKYLDESKNTEIRCEICNDTVYKIRIDDFMNDSIYNQALSIRIKIPGNWDSIWISNTEKFRTEYFNKSKFVIFNALPDNRLITIRPGYISAPEPDSGIRLVYMSCNPFSDNIRISLEVFDQQDIDIILCDMNGKLLIHQSEKNISGVINLVFDTSGISNGVYFLRIRSKGVDYIYKKVVKIS